LFIALVFKLIATDDETVSTGALLSNHANVYVADCKVAVVIVVATKYVL